MAIEEILDWVWENKEWVFSGIGVFIIGYLFTNKTSKTRISQKQKSGSNSVNIQNIGKL